MRTITKRGWWLTGLCFLGAILSTIGQESANGPKEDSEAHSTTGELHVHSGGSARLASGLTVQTLNGYHELSGLSASFTDSLGTKTNWSVRGVDQRRLPQDLSMASTEFDASLLAQEVAPVVRVDVPAGLAGQSGTLELKGSQLSARIEVDLEQREFSVQPERQEFARVFQVQVDPGESNNASLSGHNSPSQEPSQRGRGRSLLGILTGLMVGGMFVGILLIMQGALGGRLLATCLFFIIVPPVIYSTFFEKPAPRATHSELSAGPASDDARPSDRAAKWLSPGTRLTIKPKLNLSAVDGFHRITHISAWLQGVEDDQIELSAKATGNKKWSDPIQVGYVRVGPIFKTNRIGVHSSLQVELPPAERVGGKSGTLRISGVVIYPDLGKLEILNPLDIEYKLGEQAFTSEQAVRFTKESGEPGKKQNPPLSATILFSISGIGTMFLFGALLLSLKRTVFG